MTTATLNDWQKQCKQESDLKTAYGKQVAAALSSLTNQEWAFKNTSKDEFYCYPEIHLEGGSGEYLYIHFRDKKLEISGGYNITANNERVRLSSHTRSEDWRLSIGCSMTKTFNQIAKDIQRRLLPTYLPDFKLAYDNYCSYHAGQVEKNQLLNRLGKLVNAKHVDNLEHRKLNFASTDGRWRYSNEIEVGYDHLIKLTLEDLSEAEATAVLNLLYNF